VLTKTRGREKSLGVAPVPIATIHFSVDWYS